jgi:hypothetical protein
MSWEDWITIQETNGRKMTSYDVMCELCVSSYSLDKKSRKSNLKDKVHFFVLWWMANRSKMVRYTSYMKIAELLKVDHSTIVHYVGTRKPTILFDENVKCINDFLNS